MREFTKCLELLAFELKRFSLIENEQQKRAEQESRQNANAAEIAWCGKARWVQWRKEQLERAAEQHRNRCTAYTEAMRLVELLSDLLPLLSRQAIAGNIEGAAALPERLSDAEHVLGQVRLELRKRPDGAYGGRPWTSGPLPKIDLNLPRELLRLATAFEPPEKPVEAQIPMSQNEADETQIPMKFQTIPISRTHAASILHCDRETIADDMKHGRLRYIVVSANRNIYDWRQVPAERKLD